MTESLVLSPNEDDREYARLLIEIESRKQRLTSIQAELGVLETALAKFTAQVKIRLGAMKDEMRDVRLEVEELRQRAARLRDNPDAQPQDVEKEVAAEMQNEPFGFNGDRGHRFHSESPSPAPTLRSVELEAEVLRLYRELAKRYHPDLAEGGEERERRANLMLQINVAFRDRDLEMLQTFYLSVEVPGPLSPERRSAERLAWARHEVSRLDREIAGVRKRMHDLRNSETYSYWETEEASVVALDELEQRTRDRLEREKGRLAQARDAYRKLALRRKRSLRMRDQNVAPDPAFQSTGAGGGTD